MFRQVELLPNRIGYLKLDFFPDTSVCGATAKAAMAKLNDADAIIFDLRDNTGGFPDMVSLLASYLFDHPVYMYSPRGAPTTDSWTHSPVPGNKLADKPVVHSHVAHHLVRRGAIQLRSEDAETRHARRRNYPRRRARWRLSSHRRSLRHGHSRAETDQSLRKV